MSISGDVVIVGGGPVGSLLAVLLARRGLRVEVYDRASGQQTVISVRPSVNLTLSERGLRVLHEVGVATEVLEASVPIYGRAVHGRDGALTFQPYGNRREALQCISRHRLHQVLLRFALRQPGITYHFGQRCLDLDLDSNTLTFQDPRTGTVTRRQAERVIGADGAFSTVRQRLQRTSRFDYSQQFFEYGYKELTVPLGPSGRPPFERNAIHFWPDPEVGLLGMPNADGSLMLMLQMPLDGKACSFDTVRTPEDIQQLFARRAPELLPLMPDLAREYCTREPNTLVTIRCSPWHYQDKAVLVGDAAHALVPFYGQGINAGFEDCATLDACLGQSGGHWLAAFQEYFRRRKPNLDVISDLAQQHFWELHDKLGDARFHLRRRLERKLNELYPEKYLPLYSMIAFTSMSYVEAWRREQEQQRIIDQLLAVEDIEQRWNSPEVAAMRHQLMAGR